MTTRIAHWKNRRTLHRLHKSLHPMKESKPRETFWQYITRPTGFGATQWVGAIIVHVAYLGMLLQRIWWNSTAALFVFYFGLFLCFMFWIATWRNWKVDRKGLPTNPNHHMNDVRHEGKELPTMKDGSPIMDPVKWYQARYEVSREMATRAMKYESAQHEYRVYLSNPKFNRFK